MIEPLVTSTEKPIALLYGPAAWKVSQYYAAKSTWCDLIISKEYGLMYSSTVWFLFAQVFFGTLVNEVANMGFCRTYLRVTRTKSIYSLRPISCAVSDRLL